MSRDDRAPMESCMGHWIRWRLCSLLAEVNLASTLGYSFILAHPHAALIRVTEMLNTLFPSAPLSERVLACTWSVLNDVLTDALHCCSPFILRSRLPPRINTRVGALAYLCSS